MKSTPFGILIWTVFAGVATGQISPPEARLGLLQRAEILRPVSMEDALNIFQHTPDPFFGHLPPPSPDVLVEAKEASPPVRPVVRETRLADLAPAVNPSGILEIGGTRFLIFGERRLKAGDTLDIIHQDMRHSIEIEHVDDRSFTLRWNQQILTKTLQPKS